MDPLHPLVDEYQLSANADAYISSNALTVVEAEAVYNVSPPAYSIDDNYTNIKAAFVGGGGDALISARTINALAETISEAVEIFAPDVPGGAADLVTSYTMAGSLDPTNGDYADLNMGQAEAVLGANNAPDFNAGITISDSAQEIVDHSHVITSSGIAPNAVHATGVSVTEAVQIFDDEAGSIGAFAGSFDLDQAIVDDTSLTLHSIKEGRAVLGRQCPRY